MASHSARRAHPRPTPSRTLAARPAARTLAPDQVLAAAVTQALAGNTSDVAVGVTDLTTGATAAFHSTLAFDTASIVKADILATLLLRHQSEGTFLSDDEQELAAQMIEDSDNSAATALWDDDGQAAGIDAADRMLGLHETDPDPYAWGLTTTTVTDQLRLLTDLISAHSPLTASSRGYETGLMHDVVGWQHWGVSAAADPGTPTEVKNGWLPDVASGLWTINSIGIITHDNHRLLIAVLSDGHSTESDGIQIVQTAAKAAASAITSCADASGLEQPHAQSSRRTDKP